MKTTSTQEWLNLAVFTFLGIVIFTVYYLIAARTITTAEDINDYYAGVVHFVNPRANIEQIELTEKHRSAFDHFFILKLGETQSIGEVDVVFQGIENGDRFKLQIAIPALDPDSFYDYEYRIADARDSFPLGDRKAKLLSAGKKIMHLMLITDNG